MVDLPKENPSSPSVELPPVGGAPPDNQGHQTPNISTPTPTITSTSPATPQVSQPSLTQPLVTQAPPPPPTPDMPQISTVSEEISSEDGGKKKPWKIILILFLVLSILGGSLLTGAGVMVAYGKISLENEELRNTIVNLVFSLPFIPKTPEYIIGKSVIAHKDVSSATVEASLASSSKSVADLFGNQNFDLAISGPVDFTDEKQPKASIRVQLTNEFDAEFRVLDEDLYFKIDKIPTVVTSMFTAMLEGGPEFQGFDSLLGVWVHHSMETLDTEARKTLEENTADEDAFDEAYQEFVDRVFRAKILPIVEMTSADVDGHMTHELYVDLSDQLIDEVFEEIEDIAQQQRGAMLDIEEKGPRPSEFIKKLQITLWIDKDSYYLRKATVATQFDNSAFQESLQGRSSMYGSLVPSLNEKVDMVFSLKLSDIGLPVLVEAPTDAMSLEEFMTEAMRSLGLGSMMQQSMGMALFSSARFSVEQVSSAASFSYIDNQRYPASEQALLASEYIDSNSTIFSESEIKYKVTGDGQVAVIYSLVPDFNSPEEPYYGIVLQPQGTNRSKNYSGDELAEILTEHGLGVNPKLLAPVTLPVSQPPTSELEPFSASSQFGMF